MPPRRSTPRTGDAPEDPTPDIAQIIAQRIQEAIPSIVTQVTAGINAIPRNQGGSGGDPGSNNTGCNYKSFMSCKPKEFHGKEGAVGLLSWFDSMESVLHISKCSEDCKVEYAACQLQGRALTWWNLQVQTRGREEAYKLSWEEFKELLIEEYCPKSEIQKLEAELWNHSMVGADIDRYTARFHELAKLVPHMVTPESKRVDRYLYGLASEVRGFVKSASPTTIQAAVALATGLTHDAVRAGTLVQESVGNKRKSEKQPEKEFGGKVSRNQEVVRNFGMNAQETKQYGGTLPRCDKCNYHHEGACPVCYNCKRPGHLTKFCRVEKGLNDGRRACFECGSQDHFRNTCPRLGRRPSNDNNGNQANQGNQGGQARGRAFVIGTDEARHDPNVETGTFLLNNLYASVLFDTRADRSFVSLEFKPLISLESRKMSDAYIIEVTIGHKFEVKDAILDCTLNLADKLFSVDLIPIELGSFDVVIGIDWLSKNRAEICCFKRTVRRPL